MRLLSLAPAQLPARMRWGPGSPEYSWEEPLFPLLLLPLGSKASYQHVCLDHLVKPFYFRPWGAWDSQTFLRLLDLHLQTLCKAVSDPFISSKIPRILCYECSLHHSVLPRTRLSLRLMLPDALSRASCFLSWAPWTLGKKAAWRPLGSCLLPAHASFLGSDGQTSRSAPPDIPFSSIFVVPQPVKILALSPDHSPNVPPFRI